ncbi:hypothetical protein DAPPUDRAFT_304820 [Daphnia pulex]|uniref:Uncharacterized protein n=1 Tax=Daphnia pulex TaxID=6669 RepID=E9GM33_DAPPU|nr:hypothetical protein DAPPUDRAFT_304820 [Daphnia pulex]|eukprot:EFX79295.1 hypothetical protein DAPPUDRAFT_304820 [Daphnia pulex]
MFKFSLARTHGHKKKCHFLLYKFATYHSISIFSLPTLFLEKKSIPLTLFTFFFLCFYFLSAAFKLEKKKKKKKVRIIFLTTKIIKRKIQ